MQSYTFSLYIFRKCGKCENISLFRSVLTTVTETGFLRPGLKVGKGTLLHSLQILVLLCDGLRDPLPLFKALLKNSFK